MTRGTVGAHRADMNITCTSEPFVRTSSRPPSPDGRLAGAVALVTGGGRGIGRFLARALADEGAAVGVIARSRDELDETVEIVRDNGGRAFAAVADVVDAQALAAAVGKVCDALGPIDVLVNNAGVVGPIGPLWEVDPEEWWAAMDVNLRGLLLASRLVLPGMVARRRGRIINMTSQAGAHRWPLVSAYSVSKASATKLSENLAHETARHGVTVFSVHPGLLPIGMSTTVIERAPRDGYERHVRDWTMRALDDGHGAEPERAIELLVRIAAGDADRLSGRHLSVHDDLDAILARGREVSARDLYVMRPERLDLDRPTHLHTRRATSLQ